MDTYKTQSKTKVIMLLVFAMLFQIVGPVTFSVYAETVRSEDGLRAEVDGTTLNWVLGSDLNLNSGERVFKFKGDFELDGGLKGAITTNEKENLGDYTISEDGLVEFTLGEDFLASLKGKETRETREEVKNEAVEEVEKTQVEDLSQGEGLDEQGKETAEGLEPDTLADMTRDEAIEEPMAEENGEEVDKVRINFAGKIELGDSLIVRDIEKASSRALSGEVGEDFNHSDISEWIKSLNVYINGQEITNGGEIEIDTSNIVEAKVDYKFAIDDKVELSPDDIYTIDFPSFLKFPVEKVNGKLMNGSAYMGDYSIDTNGQIEIKFNNDFCTIDQRVFDLRILLNIDEEIFKDGGLEEVSIPYSENHSFKFVLKEKPYDIQGQDKKEGYAFIYKDGKEEKTEYRPSHARWTILVNDSYKKIDSAKLTDILSDGQKLDRDSFKIEKLVKYKDGSILSEQDVTNQYTIEVGEKDFRIDLGSIEDTYRISYTTKLDEKDFGQFKIKNNAEIILDSETNPLEDTININWGTNRPTIQKEGYIIDREGKGSQGGDVIQWYVYYNMNGDDKGNLIRIQDTITDGSFIEDSILVYRTEVDSDSRPIGDPIPVEEDKVLKQVNGKTLYLEIKDNGSQPLIIYYQSKIPANFEGDISNSISDWVNTGKKTIKNIDTNTKMNKWGNSRIKDGVPYVEWSININPDKYELNTIKIRDTFDSNLMELYGEVVLYNITENKSERVEVTPNSDGFTYTIENAGAHEYRLVYKTSYTEAGLKEDYVSNEAKINTDGKENSGGGDSINRPNPGISKFGTYNKDNQNIKEDIIDWKVTFNSSKLILKNLVLTDRFSEGIKLVDGSLKIKIEEEVTSDNYTLETTPNGFEIRFKDDTQAEEYTMTYKTTVDYAKAGGENNNIQLRTDQGLVAGTEDVNPGPRKPGIRKSGEQKVSEDGVKTNKWSIVINENKHAIENLVLTDEFTPDGKFTPVGTEIVSGEDGIKVYQVKGGSKVEFKDYKLDLSKNKFTISFNEKTERTPYIIEYTTSYPKEVQKSDAVNTAKITYNGGNDEATKTISKPNLLISKEAKDIKKSERPYIISWESRINTDKANNYVDLVDAILKDTIPTDQKYVDGSMKLSYIDGEEVELTKILEIQANEFTIELPDGLNEFILQYETEIVEYPGENGSGKYCNTISIENQSKSEDKNLKDKQSVSACIGMFEDGGSNSPAKSAYQDPINDEVVWEVTINEHGLPIKNAKISDKLDIYQSYDEDSIKVFALVDGKELELKSDEYDLEFIDGDEPSFEIVLEASSRTKEIQGGISHSYKIQYRTILNDKLFGTKSVSNSLSVIGKDNKVIDSTKTEIIKVDKWYLSGSASGVLAYLNVEKVDAEDANKKLGNVAFDLIRVVGDKEVLIAEKVVTNNLGTLKIDKIRAGRYILRETMGRKGYEKIDDIKLIISYDESNNPVVSLDNSDWKSDLGEMVKSENAKLIVANRKSEDMQELVDITGKKLWSGGGPAVKPTIELQLYRESINVNREALGEPIKLTNGQEEHTWYDLPKYDESGLEYKYTIDELEVPANYRKTISEDGLTVSNTFVPPGKPITPVDPDPVDPVDPIRPRPVDPVDPKKPDPDPKKPEIITPVDPDPVEPIEPTEPGTINPVDPIDPTEPEEPVEVPEVPTETIVLEPPAKGKVTVDKDGNWIYTPNPGQRGKDRFKIRKPDGTEEVFEIDLDEIPEGTINIKNGKPALGKKKLPKTGNTSNILFYSLGVLFIGAGLSIKKKKQA